jgi:carboxyl-terminal processing protease
LKTNIQLSKNNLLMRHKRRFNFAQPVFFSLLLLIGMLLGFKFHVEIGSLLRSKTGNKIDQVFNLVDKKYVDTVDLKKLESETIEGMLSQLDPHSVYIPAEDVKKSNEDLEGNFEGIGVEFFIVKDTIYVVSVIPGGPSEKLGIKAGDKIIKVNGKIVAGKKIKNAEVTGSLRGPSNSFVKISVKRIGIAKLIDFNIQRGNVPLNSLDAAYMAAPGIGYIKINTFAATTYDEFFEGITKLKKQGLKSLILDLRGNPGGYLSAAIMIADEFLTAKKLIVYTEGKSSPKKEDFATAAGNFEKGKLIVLVDEGSASASEIVAGAVQDWDRGIIVGRRSFGKGLVQEQALLNDGASLRLTIARYYTPTGRSIQKPYKDGLDYSADLYNRMRHGELTNADSINNDAQKQFKTPSGKIVYGGGGITPDVFIPLDTSAYSAYYSQVVAEGILSELCYQFVDNERQSLAKYKNVDAFVRNFNLPAGFMGNLLKNASAKNIKYVAQEWFRSEKAIRLQAKALIARQLFQKEGYYRVMASNDPAYLKSMELLHRN